MELGYYTISPIHTKINRQKNRYIAGIALTTSQIALGEFKLNLANILLSKCAKSTSFVENLYSDIQSDVYECQTLENVSYRTQHKTSFLDNTYTNDKATS